MLLLCYLPTLPYYVIFLKHSLYFIIYNSLFTCVDDFDEV